MRGLLSRSEFKRYDRQIMIDGFGEEGQERLKKTKVLVAGIGGLGSSAAIYLTAAGVGKIRMIDHDKVELSDLNRQILHWDGDIGKEKVSSAKEKLERLNPDVQIESIKEKITEDNILGLVADYDIIVDGMDNFPTRYLLNKAALTKNIPFFHGAVYGFEGRVMTIIPGKTPCLRCLYPKAPPPEKFPVVGVAPAVIGCIQATEAIKYIIGTGELLTGNLLIYDGLTLEFMKIEVKRDSNCGECGHLVFSSRRAEK